MKVSAEQLEKMAFTAESRGFAAASLAVADKCGEPSVWARKAVTWLTLAEKLRALPK